MSTYRIDRPSNDCDPEFYATEADGLARIAELKRALVLNALLWFDGESTGPWVPEACVNAVSSPEQPEPGPLTVATSGNTTDDDPSDVLWSRGFGFGDWLKQAFGMANDQDGMSA